MGGALDGRSRVTKKRVTLADVARLAGLSPSAASMILTGRPDTRLSAEAHGSRRGSFGDIRAAVVETSPAFSDVLITTRHEINVLRVPQNRAGRVSLSIFRSNGNKGPTPPDTFRVDVRVFL